MSNEFILTDINSIGIIASVVKVALFLLISLIPTAYKLTILTCASTPNNLLFGNDCLSMDINQNLFTLVQSFIEASKRFDS
jgi:hypothetical protein